MKILLLILALPFQLYAQAPCVEEKLTLLSEFVALKFSDRVSVGADQFDPAKAKIEAFIIGNPNMMVTDIEVGTYATSLPNSYSRTIDPRKDQINKDIASQRADFALQGLNKLKTARTELATTNLSTHALLVGPDFVKEDWNTRMVTKQGPEYEKKVRDLYERNKTSYETYALIKSAEELLDESRFPTLFQAKFQPYHGFNLKISGYNRELLKCVDGKPRAKKTNSPSGKIQ